MPIIPFGPFMPDQPRFGNSCIVATNVYPQGKGYGPFPGPSAVSDALAASCVGTISLKAVDGTIDTFAGTATKLFRLSGSSWTDVSKAGGVYTSSTFWRFALYGSRLVATNGVDNPQAFDIGTDSEFADLPTAPICNFHIVIREILVALDCASGDPIQWSANNDSEEWDVTCGGGSQPVPDGGPVMGGTGGEFGIILQEFGLTRMNFVGGELRFTFDKIEGAIGTIARDSIVQYKGKTFYLSEEGFQAFDGAQSNNVSDEATTDHFFDLLTYANVDQVRGALDPRNSCVIWSYPISSGTKLIIYNYRLDQWAESDAVVDCLHTSVFTGGQVLAGYDSDDKLARFSGSALTAVVSTGDVQLAKGRSSRVSQVMGLVDSAHNVTVAKKANLKDSEATVSGSSADNGKVSSEGRYHRFQITPTAAFTELSGVDIEAKPTGRRAP